MERFSGHCNHSKTGGGNMETEAKASRMTDTLPNFRRFTRPYNCDSDSDPIREDEVIYRFFRVMVEGYEKELRLPLPFCESLAGVELPDDTILVSCKGMYAFETEICSCHKLLVLSGQAWRNFISDHNLDQFDFLLFEQTDQMVFRVHVFDRSTTCQKRSVESPDELRTPKRRKRCLFGDGIRIKGCTECRFSARIEQHHLKHPYLTIPSVFLKESSLKDKKMAVLVNVYGHAWEVELHNYQDNRPDLRSPNMKLRKGWKAFFDSNRLKPGNVCVFAADHSSPLTSFTSIVMNVYITEP